jgi:isopentenyl phosphate kinase
MKNIIILKIGGSVLTHKNSKKTIIKKKLLKNTAIEIKKYLDKNKSTRLIIIHGAGQPGHSVAKKYNLASGVFNNKKKIKGALLCNQAIKKLHEEFVNIFVDAGVNIFSVDAASVITQKNKKIINFDTNSIKNLLNKNFIPVLHGQMVPDKTENLSVCSGDTISAYIPIKLKVKKILFASDIDGIFTKDPFKYKDAKLISEISIKDVFNNKKIKLSESHSLDVTKGLLGKVESFKNILTKKQVSQIIIFNGLKKEHYTSALNNEKISSTIIF